MKKYFYHNKNLRCVVERKGAEELHLYLEKRWHWSWLFFGWRKVNQEHLYVQPYAFEDENRFGNPQYMYYRNLGPLELWKSGTFNLERRVHELMTNYQKLLIEEITVDDKIKKMLL